MFNRNNEPASPGSPEDSAKSANEIRADNSRILAALARDYLKGQKTKRRRRLVFKLLVAAGLAALVFLYYEPADSLFPLPHTALVEISGVIGPAAESSDKINHSLRRAFAAPDARAVVLRINSPGGSPVQAAEINAEIRRLKKDYPEKPLYAVISDICTSGGYYVAVAADEIYANRSSLVGSIGVRLDGFGFVEAMKKLGVERRLLTAGENKGMLDPFLPEEKSEVMHAKAVLRRIHGQFIRAVRQGRGARLADNDERLFSGLFWSGEQARRLGLIDEFGSLDDVARDIVGAERIVDYTVQSSLLNLFAERVGASIFHTLSHTLARGGLVLR